ncbi:MAG: DUF4235 domain-containing protein [Jatrophihabitantaceae bacterium]
MAHVVGKIGMKVLTIVVGVPVGILTKKLVARAWVVARPQDPPHSVKQRESHWADAIGYAALASAGAVAAKLATRKGAETTWRGLTGLEPPPPPPTKAEKKLAKAAKQHANAEPIQASRNT